MRTVNDGLDVLVTPSPGGMMHDLCGHRDCYMHSSPLPLLLSHLNATVAAAAAAAANALCIMTEYLARLRCRSSELACFSNGKRC